VAAGVAGAPERGSFSGRLATARSPARMAVTVAAIRAASRAAACAPGVAGAMPGSTTAGFLCGVRARSTSRRAIRTVPSGASTTGAAPSSRNRSRRSPIGTSLITTVRAIRRRPRDAALGWCTSSARAVSSSLRRNDSATPTRIVPNLRDTSSTR
jgi:hypothetical protein